MMTIMICRRRTKTTLAREWSTNFDEDSVILVFLNGDVDQLGQVEFGLVCSVLAGVEGVVDDVGVVAGCGHVGQVQVQTG